MKRTIKVFTLQLLILAIIPADALGWGDTGHRIICEIAFHELDDPIRDKVTELIALDSEFDLFADACTYPDHPRQRGKEHYVNLSRNAEGFDDEPCPMADKCVVTAVMVDLPELALSEDDNRRLEALKFIGHWVGDVHQPLHVSFKDDRGGNEIKESGPCSRDLHAVWDTCMIERELGTDSVAIAQTLISEITDQQRTDWTDAEISIETVIDWADESYQITLGPTVKYCHLRQSACWYQPNNKWLDIDEEKKTVVVDQAYIDEHLATVPERLSMAGVRLGQILNEALID